MIGLKQGVRVRVYIGQGISMQYQTDISLHALIGSVTKLVHQSWFIIVALSKILFEL